MSDKTKAKTTSGRNSWHDAEEVMLVEAVHQRHSILYGKFRGSDRGKAVKRNAWEDVLSFLNA